MIDINNSKHKRIFCFGCSFTEWFFPTWADILKLHFENTDTEVYNFGRAGAGNYYIFNNIVEKSLEYNFTKDDLILIQWSGVLREDRFKDGRWHIPGNLTTQHVYSASIVNDWFLDLEHMIKRDYSYIHAMQKMLKADNIDYEMFSMNALRKESQDKDRHFSRFIKVPNFHKDKFADLEELYKDTLNSLHPSMYEIIWGTSENQPKGYEHCGPENPEETYWDNHPLPDDHLFYLERIFNFKPSGELTQHVNATTTKLLNGVLVITTKQEFLNDNT